MAEINEEQRQPLASDILSNFKEYEASVFQRKMKRRCIYKCPYGLITIKSLKGKHIPNMVSLGPYHHGEGQLQAMEFHKRRALHSMIMKDHEDSLPQIEAQQKLMRHLIPFMNCLSEVEEELRDCYDQLDPKWSSPTVFLEMMLLDGCFILKLLRSTEVPDNSNSSYGTTTDPIFGSNVSPYIYAVLRRDMLMLENQIPLLVLERLLHVENNGLNPMNSASIYTYLNQLIIKFFDFKFSEEPRLGSHRGLHILDVYRECLIQNPTRVPNPNPYPSTRQQPTGSGFSWLAQSNEYLRKLGFAGVTFRRSQGGWLSDVHFDDRNGVLSLPFLEIDDDTAAKFMNLLAFEQVHPTAGGQVTSYFVFMDALLDTGEDVSILISNEIIRNELGSHDAAAKLFNSLGDGVVDVRNDEVADSDEVEGVRRCIMEVRRKLNTYESSNWNKWITYLKHKYVKSPWAFMSLLAATLLLFLTILQTTYTISDYYKG